MIDLSLRGIAIAAHGEVVGAQVLAPGPNHDPRDRSLSIKLSASSPDGFIVHSFAGDSFQECRDHVKSRLGLAQFEPERTSRRREVSNVRAPEHSSLHEARRIERAKAVWTEAVDARGTLADAYLRSRGLDLADDVAGAVLWFHPRTPWKDEKTGGLCHWPCMVAAMRSIVTDEITGIHRTRLSPDGQKVDRRMLGSAAGAAIKLDADDTVTHGLAIGEGVETCLSARQFGIRPVWALASAGAIAAFPVLGGVECLTVLAEHDDASNKAVQACALRWHAAGREVLINRSKIGSDLNDAIQGAA